MPYELYILDLIGTFTFAAYGSYIGLQKKFDIFGISVCALLTACGGGTIRGIITNQLPFYFFDNNYLIVIALGVCSAVSLFRYFHNFLSPILILDAVGLVTFAYIGAQSAHSLELGLFATICFSTLNAIGGGVLRDILIKDIPEILYRDFYASVAILVGIFFYLFKNHLSSPLFTWGILGICLILRLASIHFKINLWKPWQQKIKFESTHKFN